MRSEVMKRLLVVALSMLAFAASGAVASAEDAKKKCPEGTVFDDDTGKCVVDKGS
jgi:hypothetical protein